MRHSYYTDGVVWSVCLFVAAVSCAKTEEPIEMPVTFVVWTLVLVIEGRSIGP